MEAAVTWPWPVSTDVRQRRTGDLQEANQGTKEEDGRNTMSITSSGIRTCTILSFPSHK